MLKIGDINLDVPFFQASLSGYSDRAMRLLAREFGSPLTLTGVMLDKVSLHARAIRKMGLEAKDDEHPVGAQILGADAETMAKSAEAFERIGYDLIDLNFACPAPKVLRRGRGGQLLTKPNTVMEIYRRVRQAVRCPILMKLRVGFDGSDAGREDFWRICEGACSEGVDALVIHGRTVKQKYRDRADWEIIAEVKRQFPETMIFGSGNLFDAETVVDRIKNGGVDGVIIARGAIGNPWIFSQVRAQLEGKPKPPGPGIAEQGEVMLRHFEMIAQTREIIKAVRFFRKFSVGYCKHHPQRKKVQADLLSAQNEQQVLAAIKNWYQVG